MGDVYVFDGQNNIRAKTRYAMDQQLQRNDELGLGYGYAR